MSEATLLRVDNGGFPRADGCLGDIMDARRSGEMSSMDAARWYLEIATKRNLLEAHTAAHTRYAVSRKSKCVRDDNSRALYHWMIESGVPAATARQYVLRLQNLEDEGYLGQPIESIIDGIEKERDWPNRKQLLAALRLLQKYTEATKGTAAEYGT